MEIDYQVLEKEFIDFIDVHKILILATAANNRVTARAMSCVHIGLKIYFQTGKTSIKYNQLKQNPHVALCCNNVQIEGLARIGEHPLSAASFAFKELYQAHHPGSFKTYSHLCSNVVIEVEPKFVTFWKYDAEGLPYRDFLYLSARQAERAYFDLSD
jgi:hypothetical protein